MAFSSRTGSPSNMESAGDAFVLPLSVILRDSDEPFLFRKTRELLRLSSEAFRARGLRSSN